jgi:Fe-Mn family superoxide dismutase
MKPNEPQDLNRRHLIAGAIAGSAVAAFGTNFAHGAPYVRRGVPAHELPPLPYDKAALEPHISSRTLEFHYGKHHAKYVETLNALLKENADLAGLSLEDLIKKVAGDTAKSSLFNNAAQAWNHTFYWKSMRPKGGGAPTGKVAKLIDSSFGGYDKFKEAFAAAGKGQFGSGWAWLIANGDKLEIVKTPNAETPMAQGKRCVLTMDVWEHAYYLDYQNDRAKYVATFLDSLVNWEFAEANLG